MNKEVTYSDSKLPVVYDSGILDLHQSSMTVRDCPVSVHGVQGKEEIYEGEIVEDEVEKVEPDVEATKAYYASSYVGPNTTAKRNVFLDKYASANLYDVDYKKADLKYGEGQGAANNFLKGKRGINSTTRC